MPLEIKRLQDSKAWLACKRQPELAFYMLNLWMAAWHQVPAGTLEDDDELLCDKAGCQIDRWPDVREAALRGFVKGDDGRLHHPVVEEKARDAEAYRQRQRDAANARWHGHGNATADAAAHPTAQAAAKRRKAAGMHGYGDGDGDGHGGGDGQTVIPGTQRAPADPAKALRGLTWNAYADAFRTRYKSEPLHNAQANTAIKQLCDKVGQEAPDVARWYVASPDAFYVQKAHAPEFMGRDAQKLVTEMRTGQRINGHQAKKLDDAHATVAAGAAVLRRLEQRAQKG